MQQRKACTFAQLMRLWPPMSRTEQRRGLCLQKCFFSHLQPSTLQLSRPAKKTRTAVWKAFALARLGLGLRCPPPLAPLGARRVTLLPQREPCTMLLLNYTRIRECPEQENLGLPARSPAFGLAMTSGWQQEAVAAPSQWNSRVATKLGTWHSARWPSDYVFWQRSSWNWR